MLNRHLNKQARQKSALLLSGLLVLLTGCPPQTPTQVNPIPPVNVRPIPTSIPITIGSTPVPPGVITLPGNPNTAPEPGPSQAPVLPGTGNPGQLSISDLSLPTGVLDFNYLHPLRATGGSGAYRWSLFSGTLPNGLILDQATGQIFGKPTQTGTFNFEIQLIDNGTSQAVRRQFFILVSDTNSGLNDLGILTDNLPSGAVDRRYSQTLQVSGGTPPYSWDISSGSLPDGLDLNTSTGEISGTPTLQGEETFTVRVVDARGQVGTETLSITVNSTVSDLKITTSGLPIGVDGADYNRTVCGNTFSGQLRATGGDNDFNWDISSGDLPPGLELDEDTGLIDGTITAGSEGAYTFTVKVQDGDDNAASRVYTIQVDSMLIHSFTPTSGSEGLIVNIFGEGINGSTVEFSPGGASYQFASTDEGNDGNGCDQISVATPEGANNGLLKVINGGDEGFSLLPFLINDIAINEVFTNPTSTGNQFVELLNKGPTTVGMAGWHLRYTNVNNTLSDYTLPSETPALAPGKTLVININKSGGNSATNLYTGTSLPRMLFAPIDTIDSADDSVAATTVAAARTEVGLCTASTCSTNTFRDFVEFGAPGAAVSSLDATAAAAGIWTASAVIDLTGMMANIDDVTLDTLPSTAHYGVDDNTANAGIRLTGTDGGDKFDLGNTTPDDTDVIIETFNNVPVSRRTLTGLQADAVDGSERLLINSALVTKTISSSNTGSGLIGSGILVDSTTNLAADDFLNILAGGIVRSITALTSGPRIELSSVVGANIDWSTLTIPGADNIHYDDGVGSNNLGDNGLLFDDVAPLVGASSISITINDDGTAGTGTNEFTVTRTVSNIDTTTNRVTITQPILSTTISAANTGTGESGDGIEVASTTNFLDNNVVLIRKVPRTVNVVSSTVNGFELDCPIQMQIDSTNTGDGTLGKGLLVNFNDSQTSDNSGTPVACADLATNDPSSFAVGNLLDINGKESTITKITAVGNQRRIELNAPLTMTLTGGDNLTGGTNLEFKVANTDGFDVGDQVAIGPAGNAHTCDISAILQTPPRIRCGTGQELVYSQDATGPIGDGVTEPITLTSVTGLTVGDTLRIDMPVYDLTDPTRSTITGNITETRVIADIDYVSNEVFLTAELLNNDFTEAFIAPAGTGSGTSLLNVDDITGFLDGDFVKIKDGPNITVAEIDTITPGGIANEGTIELVSPLDNPTGVGATMTLLRDDITNIYLGTGTFYPTSIQAGLNLIPKTGTVSLVPTALSGAGTDFVSFVPTSGSIFFAPSKGTVKKYHSIKYQGEGNAVADFKCDDTPNPGDESFSSSSTNCS